MKPFRIAAAALASALLLAGTATAQEVTLRLHQFLPEKASIPGRAITPWIAKIEAESGGRIKIEHYPSMQLGGSPLSLYDQARDGVVDIVWTVMGYTPGRFPKSEVFELPFMVSSGEATSRALDEFIRAHAMEEFADIHPILFHAHGPGLIHVRGNGVHTLEDMSGLKLRGPTRMITTLLEDLGATAVGMPVPAVPENISKGVIDGAVIPWEVTIPLKIPELVDAHTGVTGDRGLYTATFVLAMNKDAYEALPDDLKAIIDANSGPDVAALFGRAMDEMDVIALEKVKETDNAIIMLDGEETARWQAASQGVIDRWVAAMNEAGHDGEALLAEARALVEKYTAK